jgi:hypothetical protein
MRNNTLTEACLFNSLIIAWLRRPKIVCISTKCLYELHHFLNWHFDAMDSIHGKYGFSQEENQRMTELVMNYFESLIHQP